MTLPKSLSQSLPSGSLITDADRLTEFSTDVYRAGGEAIAIARPANIAVLQSAVRACAAENIPMVARGGGASYTDAYLLKAGGHVIFDTSALNTIAIDETNLTVTAGAGVTWQALKEALDAKGLRTPFWGPFSGIAATVGGSISQNTVSHGSAAHGISAQSVQSVQAVLANGDIIDTSAAAATRFYGPDLTGLFTGDAGAFGMKASVTLPLLKSRDAFEALSFAFDDFSSYHSAIRTSQAERLDDSHFGLDLALSQGQIARQEGVGARLQIAAEVMRKSPSKVKGLKQLVRMAVAGEDPMRAGQYMCHFIVEGFDDADAKGRAKHLRKVLSPFGREIANTMPAFVRTMPFAPLFNILGPGGERWVPIHGILTHHQAVAFDAAFKELLAGRAAKMDELGVWTGTMFSPVTSTGFLYEIALYWPDDRSAYHRMMLGDEYLGQQPQFADNAAARDYAEELKQAIIDLYQEFGAAHFQIGRAYPYTNRLDESALGLLRAVKNELDPKGLMNPGALGL
ncbi:MAG: FAD-binding oxidoreductase [Marinomonas sp.]